MRAIRTSGGLSFPFQREHGGAGLGIWSVQVKSGQPKPPKLTSERRDASPFVGKYASTARSDATPNREKLARSFRNEIDARCLGREPAGSAHASEATYRRSSNPGSSDAHRRRPQAIVSSITQRVSALGGGQRMQTATPGGEVQADLVGPPRSCRHRRPLPSQCAAPLPIPTSTCGRQQSLQVRLWIGAEVRRPRRHHALHGEVELLCQQQFANLSP